jgi:hypothetical protein
MSFLLTLLAGIAFPASPTLAGWFVWVFLLAVLVYALYLWRGYQPVWNGREWGFFFAFLISLLEFFHTAGSVHEQLLASEKGM